MIVSSLLRCFYWLGARFSLALLTQALIMIVVQLVLLKIALLHRPPPSSLSTPFAPALSSSLSSGAHKRPYNFWQWRNPRPYFQTLLYFFLFLLATYMLFPSSPTSPYTISLGYLALGIEATLPLPQMLANYRRKSCRGFRGSVLGNWILGDVMKMVFFFLADQGKGGEGVPWSFKACGLFQFACDIGLGAQWWWFRDGEEEGRLGKEKARV